MIKQKNIVIKTASATLTYAEMGDIVCNSSSAITITLPSPNSGLWYRISNANNGVVTVYYGSNLTTISKNEFCMCYANTTVGWIFTKSGGLAEIPQATETVLGGIKAKPKTTETNEVAIDEITGKLYVSMSDGDGFSLPDYMPTNGNGIKIYDEQNNLIATIGRIVDDDMIGETDLVPAMTSNTAPSGIVSASSQYSDKYAPWRVFDKSSHQWIAASNVKTGWLAYELPDSQIVNKYTLLCGTDRQTAMPLNWTIEGWDGSSWIILDTRASITGWTNGVKKVFEFENSTSYKKYRINVTANNGYATLQIGEWEMFHKYIGGFHYGIFTDQYMSRLIGNILPTPSVDYRGQIFTLLGATGVADIPYICIKDATDTYVWQAI